jgi:hypothetical protein
MVGACHWQSDREQEMSFLAFFEQLSETDWSVAIHESEYEGCHKTFWYPLELAAAQ